MNSHIPFIKIIKGSLIAFLLSCSTIIYAQQRIDPTVEVKRDFDSKLLDTHKSKLNTSFNDSLKNFSLNFNYSIFNKTFNDLYEFSPLPSAQINETKVHKYPTFFAKVGLNIPINPYAYISFSPKTKDKLGLLFNISHNSFWGKLPLSGLNSSSLLTFAQDDSKTKADNSNTEIGATLNSRYNGGQLAFNVNYTNAYNTFYGSNFYDKTNNNNKQNSHTYNAIDLNFNIESIHNKEKAPKFNYNIRAQYSYIKDESIVDINGHYFKIASKIGPSFGKYSKLLLGIQVENSNREYNGASINYGLIDFTPEYKIERGRWLFNLGIRISIKYENQAMDNYYNAIFAKANVEYQFVKDKFIAYAKLDGYNNLNDYRTLTKYNKWLSPYADTRISSTPFLINLGFKGKIAQKLNFNIYGAYTAHKGLVQFINDKRDMSSFNLAYSNHTELSIVGELGITTKDFLGGVRFKYSSFSSAKKGILGANNTNGNYPNSQSDIGDAASSEFANTYPWGYAPFELRAYGEYNIRERIYLSTDIMFRAKTPAKIIQTSELDYSNGSIYQYNSLSKINSFVNLSLSVKYVFNKNFTFFIKGDNLLNNYIQYYSQYLEPGISFGAGFIVKF